MIPIWNYIHEITFQTNNEKINTCFHQVLLYFHMLNLNSQLEIKVDKYYERRCINDYTTKHRN